MSGLRQSTDSAAIGFAVTPGPHGTVTRGSGTKGSGAGGDENEEELRRKQKLTSPGMPTINNRAQLKAVMSTMVQTERDKLDPKLAKYVTQRAYALGLSSMLTSEVKEAARGDRRAPQITTTLALEGIGAPAIVQEASPETNGRMRIRVPFYVGNSVARAPGFDQRIFFSEKVLPGIIQEAKAQIAKGQQPLNVYARHQHATTADHLPIGAVVGVEQEGRIGYSVIELEPIVPDGVNAMTLIRGKKLNAVSLRSREGQFELREIKVNGEIMLEPTRMAICGVDFAPDSPAQPTYGIEVLAAEARVEAVASNRNTQTRRSRVNDEITLEALKAEHSDIVQEIEAPLRKEIAKVTSERDALVAEKRLGERDAHIVEIAQQFPDPAKALPLLQEHCKEAKSKDDVAKLAMPVLLRALKVAGPITQEKSTEDKLLDLFPSKPGGAGDQSIKAETNDGAGVNAEMVGSLPVPA